MKTPEQLINETTFVTYYSATAAPKEAWLAYPVLATGEQWLVRSVGTTEAQALERAQALWNKEVHKNFRLVANVKPDVVDTSFNFPSAKPSNTSPSVGGGRGKVFIGKTWMVLRDKKGVVVERARVADDQLTAYEGEGWTRGGPRTK